MQEVNLHYFVPESKEELETLIGRPVGVFDSRNFVGMLCATVHKPEDLDRKTAAPDEFVYEFLLQGRDDSKFTPVILGYVPRRVDIQESGISINPADCNSNYYRPKGKGYSERLQLLKQSNSWREPQ